MSTHLPHEPAWVAPLVRATLGREAADEFRADLAAARPPRAGACWYARQLVRADFLRLAWRMRRGRRPADAWSRSLRDAARGLRRGGGLPALCLVLGVGLCGAAFGAVRSVLLAPLPFRDGHLLVTLERVLGDGEAALPLTWMELDVARHDPGLAAAEAWDTRSYTLVGPERADHVSGATVTPGLFPMLGVDPALGRGFAEGEGAEAGFEDVVILGHGIWLRQFGGDPEAVGRTLTVNERAVTVVGVMPPGFSFPVGQELWMPLGTTDTRDAERRYLSVVGRRSGADRNASRTAGGASRAADHATASLPDRGEGLGGGRADQGLADRLAQRMADADPASAARPGTRGPAPSVRVRTLREAFTPAPVRRFLPLLLGGGALVLLISCANVATLLLVRSLRRQGEMALRVALGADRGHLLRLVLAETAVLAAVASVGGVFLAAVWLEALSRRLPGGLPYWTELTLDAPAVAAMVGISVLTAGLAAGVPVARVARGAPSRTLGSHRSTVTRRSERALVGVEVALGFVLLASAALLSRSAHALLAADAGFDDRGVASFRVVLSGDAYDGVDARLRFLATALGELGAAPGIQAVAGTTALPGVDGGASRRVGSPTAEGPPRSASVVGVSGGYFGLLGVQAIAGRLPTPAEAADTAADVVVVDAALAAFLWPEGGAVGRALDIERLGTFRVVGVVDGVRYAPPGSSAPTEPSVHVPWARIPSRALAVLARSQGTAGSGNGGPAEPETGRPGRSTPGGSKEAPLADRLLRDAVAAADPLQAPYDLASLPERRRLATAQPRLFAALAGEMGAVALILALAGLHGVVAHDAARRRREIGIRLALGAPRADVFGHVVASAARPALAGVAAGVAVLVGAGAALRPVLYGVGRLDPASLAWTAALLLGTGAVAAAWPALRAVRTDPSTVLGSE